jgi:glycosyltransferase involved in cell wall biosynthesis
MDEPMLSIVTPSLNQGRYIEKNILSVIGQNDDHFEHIIIDGGSTDGTIDILRKYNHLRWISENDSGQSQAINKGFKMTRGSIIGWLNSDDVYCPNTFRKVRKIYSKNPSVDFIFSHCLRIDENDNILGFLQGRDPKLFSILNNTNHIPQPTVFFRDTVLKTTGYLDERYLWVMDFDFWRRISKNHEIMLINDIFACFRMHNQSKTVKYLSRFRYESKSSFFRNGGSMFSPYYFETFIRPKLEKLFIYNPIVKRLFFHGK